MKLVCIGDSLTFGYGIKRSEAWTRLIAELHGLEVLNKGVNGDTSGGMLSRFQYDVVLEKPDMVMIMGGVNDLIMGAPVGVVQANITAMAHQARGRMIRPIIGIPTPVNPRMARQFWSDVTDFEAVAQMQVSLREGLMKFCKDFGVHCIDFYLPFQKAVAERGEHALYIDGLHPTAEGNRIMAETFFLP